MRLQRNDNKALCGAPRCPFHENEISTQIRYDIKNIRCIPLEFVLNPRLERLCCPYLGQILWFSINTHGQFLQNQYNLGI